MFSGKRKSGGLPLTIFLETWEFPNRGPAVGKQKGPAVVAAGPVLYFLLDSPCLKTHFQLSPNGSGTYRRPEPASCQISPTIHSWPLLSTNSWVPFMDLASL